MRYDLESIKNLKPSSNFSLQAKLSCEFKNQCRELFENFGKRLENTADRWAKRLLDADFTLAQVRDGVEAVVNTCEKLPSYSQYVDIIRKKAGLNDDMEARDQLYCAEYQTDQEKFLSNKKEVMKKIDQDTIDKYVGYWIKAVYSENFHLQLEKYGYGLRLFEKPAINDLFESRMDSKKAIEIGRKKRLMAGR